MLRDYWQVSQGSTGKSSKKKSKVSALVSESDCSDESDQPRLRPGLPGRGPPRAIRRSAPIPPGPAAWPTPSFRLAVSVSARRPVSRGPGHGARRARVTTAGRADRQGRSPPAAEWCWQLAIPAVPYRSLPPVARVALGMAARPLPRPGFWSGFRRHKAELARPAAVGGPAPPPPGRLSRPPTAVGPPAAEAMQGGRQQKQYRAGGRRRRLG